MGEDRCRSVPSKYWEKTVVCYRNWWSGMHVTAHTTIWFWVASTDTRLPRTYATSGNGCTSPLSHKIPRAVSTTCSRSSGGKLPIHLRGKARTRHGFHRKPGNLSTPGLRHAGAESVLSEASKHSAVRSKRVFRMTGTKGWMS